MAYNFQSPFAQALISEGRARGYSPFAIAASLGNAATENALQTNGRPGDNGTAFGGFQWRNERKSALDQLAAQQGKSWDDPAVQAKHWFNEADGSESRWGLKGAGDLNSAVNSGVSMLRPAGWQAGNPTGGHNYQGRLAASKEALAFLNGGQGPAPADTQIAGSSGSDAVMGNQGQDTINAPPKEGWEAFMEGGPGALFGKPQEGWNLGDALGGAGVALMARDNPQGASAMASYINSARRSEDRFKTIFDRKSGKLIKVDRNGAVSVSQATDPEKNISSQMTKDGQLLTIDNDTGNITNRQQAFTPEEKPTPSAAIKLFEDNRNKADVALKAAEDNQKWIGAIQNGEIDLSALGRLGNNFSQFLGDSDPKVQKAAQFMQHMENLRNARLLEAKGVQTEGDAVRAMETLLPGNSKFDGKSVATLLNNLNGDFLGSAKRAGDQYDNLSKNYKNYDPDGLYKQQRDPRFQSYADRQKAIDERMPGFLSGGTNGAPQGQPTPVTGQNPARPTTPQPQPSQGTPDDTKPRQGESFRDFYKRTHNRS